MGIPILKQHDYLIVSVQGALTDASWADLRQELVDQVGKFRTRGVIVDISALDVLDSFASRTLSVIAQATKLRGAVTVVVGMQPDVAFTMVQLGLGLEGIMTALDLEEGLAVLNQYAGRNHG